VHCRARPHGVADAIGLQHARSRRDGLIANDKFCLSRFGRLRLSWWRLPLRARQVGPAVCPSPRYLPAAGDNDAGLAGAPDIAAPSGRAATLGPSLSAAPGVDAGGRRLPHGPGRRRVLRTGGQP
jgi:hypothetical protein